MRKANQIKPRVKALVYGKPGSGKTTFAASGHRHPGMGETLVFDVEDGSLSISDTDVLLTDPIKSIVDMEREFKNVLRAKGEYEGIGTVVIDSATRFAEIVLAEVVKARVERKGNGSIDKPEIQDYQVLTNTCSRIFQWIRDLPLNVIVTALAKETSPEATTDRPFPKPEDCRPELTRKLGELTQAMFDHVWFMSRSDDGTHRMLTQRFGIFHAKTRGPQFAARLGEPSKKSGAHTVTNPSLAEIYDLLIETQGNKQ